MSYQFILTEKADRIGRIILNRPEKLNAINFRLRKEVVQALKEMERDDAVKVIIIKGAGRAFSAGYDMVETREGGPESRPPSGYWVSPQLDRMAGAAAYDILNDWRTIWDLLKPVIAQIHGYCVSGGWELSCLCDLRIVAEDAIIGSPVQRMVPVGHLHHHPWLLGLTKAKEVLLTGDSLSGKEAVQWKWANHAYPADKLEEEVEKLASRMANIPSEVLMLSKRACNRTMEIMGFRTAMDSAIDLFIMFGLGREEGEFQKIAREKGLKAALDWRDGSFGDYRTAEDKPGQPS